MAHAYPGIAVINPEILFNAQRTTERARLYIDTGCSISIVNSASQLINVLNIHPINVQGVAGSRTVAEAGDLHIKAADNAGVFRTIIINNVLLDRDSPVNLLSGDQLRVSGFAIRIDPDDSQCVMILNPRSSEPIHFPIR
eukprot:276045-Rhodomonas_salina.1